MGLQFYLAKAISLFIALDVYISKGIESLQQTLIF
jgi:hypothetical protein